MPVPVTPEANRPMLKNILEAANLEPHTCADLLGINASIFAEWVSNQRPIPLSFIPRLSTALGVQPSILSTPTRSRVNFADVAPAIWYKLRGERLIEADRECVFLIRQLGHFVNELENLTQKRTVGWRSGFEEIRRATDNQAPPREQGRQAARVFRQLRGLAQGRTGIGEVFRGNLRSMGVLLIESPIPESQLEGCSFYVGSPSNERPCIFANIHNTTWFRRNVVLMHEVGHSIFDSESSGASLDFERSEEDSDFSEQRSQAFALETLIPAEVLRHIAQSHGIRWEAIHPHDLARLVADTGVEQKTIVSAAEEAELIDSKLAASCCSMDIASILHTLTDRALSTQEYIQKVGPSDAGEWLGKRMTTIPSRNLRLPSAWIRSVLQACSDGEISKGKAAEYLMIDEDSFEERFGSAVNWD
jgi:Zn-dependent peptidase ImmA (M78 family)/transcriptional regulator with XRE-family HTH domain